ncbi:hypothetical protein ACF1G0_33025 [Streptomyces sp. NPDC013953]|uniref:hypothetical protein n=1 Tax=Streptomyces sp. NPDC013953 TaxID=3364868 RepID=UPI0036F821C7
MTSVLYPDLPDKALIVLIGASGAGKSTLSHLAGLPGPLLDWLRGVVSDDFSVKFSLLSSASDRHEP